MIDGPAFVTPHALAQFRARVAALPPPQARAVILDGLRRATRAQRRRDGGWLIRVRRPLPFRAVLVADPAGRAPAVVTILRSGR